MKNKAYDKKINKIFNILDTNHSGTIDSKDLENIYPDAINNAQFDVDDAGNLGIEELKELIDNDELATKVLKVLNQLKKEKDKYKYERSLDDIFAILDTDKSGTIYLEELEKLYPDAAQSLLERFDLNNDGELDAEEFKDFVDSLKVANNILKRLQAQEYEKNIIQISDYLVTDSSESISLKKLSSSHPYAANYLFTHFDLDEKYYLDVEALRMYINSYELSKEFLKALKTKVEFKHGLFDCWKTNYKMCTYVTFCHCCAIADLSVLIDGCCIDNLRIRWWIVMLACVLPFPHFISIYIAWASSQQIADKLKFHFDRCSFGCCFQYLLCWSCKICQIANQLGEDKQGFQSSQTVELVTRMNKNVPFKNILACVKNTENEEQIPQTILV